MAEIFLKVQLTLHLLPLELLYGRDGKESEKKCDQNNLKDESGELLHKSGRHAHPWSQTRLKLSACA